MNDIRIISSIGLTDDDLQVIAKVQGVKAVYGANSKDVLINYDDKESVAHVLSIPLNADDNDDSYINRLRIKEGRLPQNDKECVVKYESTREAVKVGDVLKFKSGTSDDINDTFKGKVTVVDTGLNTMTGGRIKRVQKYVGNEPFLMTYGDGVCDVDISKLVEFHKEHGKIATLTSVMLEQQKGVLDIGGDNAVKSFREKSVMDGAPINAGYMVLNPEIFDYIEGDNTVFEKDPLEKLAKEGQLMSYMHNGFWQCMDNKREMDMLEKYLSTGTAPWKKW